MASAKTDVAVIILAAGLGTRMKSSKAKVLHTILGKPMILYVVDTARQIAGENVIVVVGHPSEGATIPAHALRKKPLEQIASWL